MPGCVTTQGPRPIFGKFAMKPFLAQGAYISSKALNDFTWIEPVYERIKKVCRYREKTQFDPKYGLFFWDNAMQSGADNTPVLTNDDRERSAILGVDIAVFQYREYLAWPRSPRNSARRTMRPFSPRRRQSSRKTFSNTIGTKSGFPFWNIRRRDGRAIKRVSYSNFVPLIQKDLLPQAEGAR